MRLSFPQITLCAVILCSATAVNAQGRQRIQLDKSWKFHLGDFEGPEPGIAIWGWQWKPVTGGRREAMAQVPKSLGDQDGWTAGGTEDIFKGRRGFAWYRFPLPEPGHRHLLHFENVDDNATVFLDGVQVGANQGWNTPFDADLTSALQRPWGGGPHVVAVLVENTNAQGGINGSVTLRLPMSENPAPPIRPNFDDLRWRTVDLPHDFVVEGTFSQTADGSHGFLPAGVGWYRKELDLPASDRGKRLFLDFDGIYRDSDIWINGKHAKQHPSGYMGFRVDATDYLRPGEKNVITVRADGRHFEGWWYEGGGIYRHVWLVKTEPVHVAHWGTFVNAVPGPDPAHPTTAAITVRETIKNDGKSLAECSVRSEIIDPQGRTVAKTTSRERLEPGLSTTANHSLQVSEPQLWSIERPNLYRLTTVIEQNGKLIDRYITPFGIRTFRFDAAKGFFLNGKPLKLKGTCNHQDFAGVGVALPDRLHEYKIERLKDMGSNAYRCSHNPPAQELLEACDRLGMLVMDENRHLGDTYSDHSPSGTGYSDLSDLKEMILRDRNHPSVIMWSMCNEENLQGSPEGARIFDAMMKTVRSLDPTRPVTCAMNGGWGQGISLIEDLMGCNYHPDGYDAFHRQHLNIPVYGSETASTVSTRGIYENDPKRGYVSAYDVNAPEWAQVTEIAWPAVADREYMAGYFAWTGFDYRGEPTPYWWPCINSHFGIMDTCGFPKDNYFYYLANWTDKPIVHLLPHWTWPGKEGQKMNVWCYSNCDRVELLLNGTSLGVKPMDREHHQQWDVPYAPGKLEARGYRSGKVAATDVQETAGAPAAIKVAPYRPAIAADGTGTAEVWISVVDAKGRVVSTASSLVRLKVEGPGRIIGVGNGDPSSHEPDKAERRSAFNGYCMVVVQSTGRTGSVKIIAESDGLKGASGSVRIDRRLATEREASD